MTFDDYQKLSDDGKTIVDLLSATPGVGDIDFEIPRFDDFSVPAKFD
jgi:hypothetical protein